MQTVLAIDIGSYSIKIAKLERSFKAFKLTDFYERHVQYNDVLTKDESLFSTIRSIIEDNNLTWDSVVTALPGDMISSRMVELPFGSQKKIAQLIEFEIENHIPFSAEDVVLDYHIIDSTKVWSKVFVVYAQKSDFAKFLLNCQGIDIDPRWVCVEGIEYLNLMHIGMVPPESTYSVVDLGHSKTTAIVCRGKQFLYARVIPIGGRHITEEISKNLQIPFDEAERMKVEMGQVLDETDEASLDDLSRKIASSVRKVTNDIALQLRQTFFSLRSGGAEPVSGVYLCGGTSRLNGVDSYLSSYLSQNVTFLDPRDFHFVQNDTITSHHSVASQAIALALRGVAGAGLPNVNLRRGELAFKGDVVEFGGTLRRASMLAGGIVVLAFLYFALRHYTLRGKLDQVSVEASQLVKRGMPDIPEKSLTSSAAALRTVKNRRSELSEKLGTLKDVLNWSMLEILKEVSSIIPSREDIKLDIDTFDVNSNKVRLTGRATSFETVDKIKSALSRSPLFKDVTSGNVRKGVGNEIKFDLNFLLVESDGGSA